MRGALINSWDGNRFRQLRQHLGLSQSQLADSLSVSSSYLSMLENGARKPSEHLLRLLCLTYGVSKTWLENGQGEMLLSFTRPSNQEKMGKQTPYNRESMRDIIHLVCQATSGNGNKPALSEGQVELILDLYEKSANLQQDGTNSPQNLFKEFFS